MKYRNSFVTNSSSSSYIIAVKKENDELPQDIQEKLIEWAKNEIFAGNKISTMEELEKFIIDEYGYRNQTLEEILNDDEYAKNNYEELKEKIEKGFVVYKNWVSCEGQDEHLDMLSRAFNKLAKSENFEEIDTDMYY